MKVTEGNLVTLIREEPGDQKEHLVYLEAHPELKLVDIETLPSGRETWYWYVDQTLMIDGKIKIDLSKKYVILLDPIYTRMRLRLRGTSEVKDYLDFLVEAVDIFKKENVGILYIPQVEGGQIQVIELDD